jgi:hypothetical protein
MSRKSLSGCEYYLTFIDDYSRKTWIYFLKAKSEVFARFQEFRALVENQSGKRIKSCGRITGESIPRDSLWTSVHSVASGDR